MAAYRKANSESLSDSYIKGLLRMPFVEISRELIELKREQVAMKRLTKQLVQVCEKQMEALNTKI